MQPKTVKIATDINGTPFIVDACRTDHKSEVKTNRLGATTTRHTMSSFDFFEEELSAIGNAEDVFGDLGLNSSTIYVFKYRIDGSWDYEHTEYDYDIILTEISKTKLT